MTAFNPLEFRISPGDLVAEIKSKCPKIGTNDGLWPGLTMYRFDGPAAPMWEEVRELHLCVIAQGRKCVTTDGVKTYYDPLTYFAIQDSVPFRTEIVEASRAKPFLSFGLQLDHELVRQVSSDIILERRTTAFTTAPRVSAQGQAKHSFVSALDRDMMDAILRFLRAISNGADRRVLAPVYLKEIVYRALQAEQYERLIARAASESKSNPVSAIIAYVNEHLAEPLSVSDLAERAFMSPSAFSHLFRDVAGRSPYQFIKEMRLTKARELLIENESSITSISKSVGYRSTSHFINEFRDRYGMTPRACSEALAGRDGGQDDDVVDQRHAR
ncbi:AraC family transcriptional regulator [Pseudonocardia endophytica]|uniref:AraC-like DNA-binding protein n=1 Tax=Pseudonocardia endophytica TaxID=401976 RepID=A0A4R1HQJ3_PSEEN|nr:AraC family transcriptional regulator [Pseudonocardia endophytica]TCK22029.1 AraC-like DNA-binding protein [Pseudonocardia endophytica]